MREIRDTITTVENYLSQDPLVKVTEKLGFGNLYKKAVLNNLVKSPDVQIDGNSLMIHESYNNTSISNDLKALGHETLSTAGYIAAHPKDIAGITYNAAKEIITNPKALAAVMVGLAIGNSGCISIDTGNTATIRARTIAAKIVIALSIPFHLTIITPYSSSCTSNLYKMLQ